MKVILTILMSITLATLVSCHTDSSDLSKGPHDMDSAKPVLKTPTPKSLDDLNSTQESHCLGIKIIPEDNSYLDTSIYTFNEELGAAVDHKDAEHLLKLLDEKITISHGGGISGINNFIDYWKLNAHPEASELWLTLGNVLKLGGCFDSSKGKLMYIYPYVQSSHYFKGCDFDWFSTCVCTKPHVYLYRKPTMASIVLDTLEFSVLDCGYERITSGKFISVKTHDTMLEGYVLLEDLYFTADYMLSIEKKHGAWKVTSFALYD